MKKKIIGIAVAASLMLTGVVSAASVWGSYKGNDIIRITSNGAAIKTTDVPAINYNGRTMIPINMLLQLGIPYTWDQTNKTVDVTTTQVKTTSLDNIKNAVKYAEFFHTLENLGSSLSNISNLYSTAANEIMTDRNTSTFLTNANSSLNSVIDFYNSSNEEAKKYSDSELDFILKSYYDAISYYSKMDEALNDFKSNNSKDSLSAYSSNNILGIKQSIQGSKSANNRFYYYIDIALNSK